MKHCRMCDNDIVSRKQYCDKCMDLKYGLKVSYQSLLLTIREHARTKAFHELSEDDIAELSKDMLAQV